MNSEAIPFLNEQQPLTFTSMRTGLLDEQVAFLLKIHGFNESTQKKSSSIKAFFDKFTGTSAFLLELTCIISVLLGKWDVAIIVLSMLVFNNTAGMYQEFKAQKSLEELMKRLELFTRVLRNGKWILKLPAKELVPGDIVRIRQGDLVPADCIIRDGAADYAALTGESVQKSLGGLNEINAGASLTSGEVTAQVLRTGKQTIFGQTVSLISTSSPKSHTAALLNRITIYLSTFIGSVLLFVWLIVFLQEKNSTELIPLLLLLLAGSIPVALPTMISISTAIGSAELTKYGVLTTRLDAIEDCARMTVLCCDKTGTITGNKLSILGIAAASEDDNMEHVIRISEYACHSANKDPIDLAFLNFDSDVVTHYQHFSLTDSIHKAKWLSTAANANNIQFVPFDPSKRRFTTCILSFENSQTVDLVIKGSLPEVMSKCHVSPSDLSSINDLSVEWASKGWRSIAVACTKAPLDLTRSKDQKPEALIQLANFEFVGLVALSDPPRADSKENIQTLQDLGIEIIILTGDALAIAQQVAHLVGLDQSKVYSMGSFNQLVETPLSSADLESGLPESIFCSKLCGLAHVLPQDKHRIITQFQRCGRVVGMTGDGINDAPALKMVEVGIAMSNATDIAKKSASFVLMNPGLSGISSLVITGRRIHHRITTWILNKLIKTSLTTIYIVLAYLIYGIFVVDAFHMVVLLVLVDFLTLSLANDPVRVREAFHKTSLKQPQHYNFKILLTLGGIIGSLCVVEIFLFFILSRIKLAQMNTIHLQTLHVQLLYYFASATVLSVRERSWFWRSFPSILMINSISLSCAALIVLSHFEWTQYLTGVGIQMSIIALMQVLNFISNI